ncbi:MAG: zinc ribbon domain-containing protein [Spirochaetes bacterium]|nr:zinc ribbon domain-containing protein [Spirochaetota bacterium]
MPVYEFRCLECKIIFSELRSMGDYTPGKCPSCGSKESEKIFSLFFGGKGGTETCAGCSGKSSGKCATCH